MISCLKASHATYEVIPAEYHFTTWTYEDMFVLCRNFTLEDLFTPKTYEALGPTERERVDQIVRQYAQERKTPHGNYRLTHQATMSS